MSWLMDSVIMLKKEVNMEFSSTRVIVDNEVREREHKVLLVKIEHNQWVLQLKGVEILEILGMEGCPAKSGHFFFAFKCGILDSVSILMRKI